MIDMYLPPTRDARMATVLNILKFIIFNLINTELRFSSFFFFESCSVSFVATATCPSTNGLQQYDMI